VLLGCPARFTGMLPAKLRGSVPRPVMLGKFSVTSKSAVKPFQPESRVQRRSGLTALPFRTEVAFWLSRPRMRKRVWYAICTLGENRGADSENYDR
jgi:hypothetical protein